MHLLHMYFKENKNYRMGDYLNDFIEKASQNKKQFGQMAAELGIEVSAQRAVMPVIETSIQPPVKRKRTGVFLRWAGLAASVLVIVIGVVLGVSLRNNSISQQHFTERDSMFYAVTLEHIEDNVLLFNREQILNADDNYLGGFRHVVREGIRGAGLLLAYTTDRLVFRTLDEQNVFFIDFRVRMHRYYSFFELPLFERLPQNFEVNGTRVYYSIFYDNQALVRFTHNNLDYFLALECFLNQSTTTAEVLATVVNELFTA